MVDSELIGSCELFGNTSWALQFFRGALSFSFLIGTFYLGKRWVESDPRCNTVWVMDIGKQAIGAGLSHALNLVASLCFTMHDAETEECMWYFMNSLIEALLGTLMCYALLLAVEQMKWPGTMFGYYGMPPSWRLWQNQVYIWGLIVFVMKIALFAAVILFNRTISLVGDVLLSPLDYSPELKLALIMVAAPILLSGTTFWVTDNFLRSAYTPFEPLLA
jgi:hypothetical protein